jgi:hypothetical protein
MCTTWRICNLAQCGKKRLWSCNHVLFFKLIDLAKGNSPRGFWSSPLIWKRGHDCSSNDVFFLPYCANLQMRQIVHMYPRRLWVECLPPRSGLGVRSWSVKRIKCRPKFCRKRTQRQASSFQQLTRRWVLRYLNTKLSLVGCCYYVSSSCFVLCVFGCLLWRCWIGFLFFLLCFSF